MKTSKKMLSLLLIAAMLVSVLCMGVSASDYAEVSISEGEPVTISWSGTTGTVVSVDGSSYIPRQFILWVRNGFTVSVDGTALTPNSAPSAGVFGETSAEVCGLYVANAESSSVGTTAAPAITLANGPIPLDMATSMGNNVFYIPAETFEGAFTSGVVVTATASSSTAKVFINGESTGTFTIQDASRGVQILVQDGNSAPFILVIK